MHGNILEWAVGSAAVMTFIMVLVREINKPLRLLIIHQEAISDHERRISKLEDGPGA